MTRIIPVGLIAMTCLMGSVACSDSVSLSTQTGDFAADDAPSIAVTAFGVPDARPDPADQRSPEEQQIQYAELRAEVLAILSGPSSFTERDLRLREYLTNHRNFSLAHYLEQFAATRLLREATGTADQERIEAIDHHARVLLRNGSPEAKLILIALQQLCGTWSTDELQRAARISMERGLAWAEKVCSTCDARGQDIRMAPLADEMLERKREEIIAAATQLQELAGL
ncbi:MAG: hypothetical protein HKN37_07445 [Rhodothermales bacterium]|nr:hypothetical protein [Rhodothermales bacterium]